MLSGVVCPMSFEKIDSNVSRLTVFSNVLLMAAFIITLNPIFIIIVLSDYFIRAFLNVKFSLIKLVVSAVTKLFQLKKKPINLAQKIFASRLGVICAVISLVLFLTGYNTASIIMTSFLMALSILDSVFNFCVGCLIYNYLVYPFYKNK